MKSKTQEEKQQKLLQWILHEWDCNTIEEAIKESKNDYQLRLKLVECGIQIEN